MWHLKVFRLEELRLVVGGCFFNAMHEGQIIPVDSKYFAST